MHSEVPRDSILTVMMRFGPPSLKNFLRPFQAVFQNILCARLLFHIRSLGDEPSGTSSCEGGVSTLVVARSERTFTSVNINSYIKPYTTPI
ncbi:hypothetical protein SCHPADRAFT_492578 [Schizopora paradoxa]|uniref:Uncharacterized protein n=1 Tax=Schizopora paradoxa TaxID=27342 RepID=A0A0H2S219_9AGAM|nr:hypothetical protein SCHPADRAFT_492578 [Schizopora paradoxa]